MRIDAQNLHYRQLNEKIHRLLNKDKQIILDNINGQRYIGAGIRKNINIIINGIPGNDLGVFMDGPTIMVSSDAQDGIGNTMSGGKIIVYGNAGDIVGHSMRGGKIYIRGDVGYRVGIHMKSYEDLYPIIIIGGKAGDFLGEYMAGGIIIVLGLEDESKPIVGNFCGTGMHGGTIYIRGNVEKYKLSKEGEMHELDKKDRDTLREHLKEYCADFSLDLDKVLKYKFIKLLPHTHRPYGKLYAY